MGYIHSIETFGSVDGPGIRFIAFVTGCSMRCQFCHNPDTWEVTKGEQMTADELIAKAKRYRTYWGTKGGITISGGEPLIQIDFVTEVFRKAKEEGINTCLDTSGQPFTKTEPWFAKFNELMKYTDLVMLDIKQIDDEKHKILTGHSNKSILECAEYLKEIEKPVWIRHVLVSGGEGASDNDEDLHRLKDYLDTLPNVERVDVLPYHTFGSQKWEKLGLKYPLEGVEPPTMERIENAINILDAFR